MDQKNLSWNIRGLGQDPKIIAIISSIRKNNPSIVTIQESKLEVVDELLFGLSGGAMDVTIFF